MSLFGHRKTLTFRNFVISLLLLQIFTWNLKYVFTIQSTIHAIKGDNSKYIFFSQNHTSFLTYTFYPLSSNPLHAVLLWSLLSSKKTRSCLIKGGILRAISLSFQFPVSKSSHTVVSSTSPVPGTSTLTATSHPLSTQSHSTENKIRLQTSDGRQVCLVFHAGFYQYLNMPLQPARLSMCCWVGIYQLFWRTFFVFFSNNCKFECHTTSDWLKHMV